MSAYEVVKLVHILSASVLFGTGIGIAFFMLRAHLSSNKETFIAVSRYVVRADWIFTTPAVVVQFATGMWLAHALGVSFRSVWFVSVVGLFVFVGACWLPVVWIQLRLVRLARTEHGGKRFSRLMNLWIALGASALIAMLAIFYLMVTKVGLGTNLFA